MKMQTIIGTLVIVSIILLSTGVQAQVTDDFGDGIIAPMWHVMNRTSGISVTEGSGYLQIAGTRTTPSIDYHGIIANDIFKDTTDVEMRVNFQFPTAVNGVLISLLLKGVDGLAQIAYIPGSGYQLVSRSRAGEYWSPVTSPKGNETTTYNRLKLLYNITTDTVSVYVCDADGSNEQLVASTVIDLGPIFGAYLYYWTTSTTTMDVQFDDFYLSADPYDPVVEPAVSTSVALSNRQEFQADTDDITLPMFSNDGTKLAYLKRDDPDPANGIWNIYVKELEPGGSVYRVTEDSDYAGIRMVFNWSPNGERIYFATETPAGAKEIRYVDATETTDRVSHLYLNGGGNSYDGIDFTRTEPYTALYTKNYQIYTISVDEYGNATESWDNARRITDTFEMGLYWPKWSPDGTKIVAGHGVAIGQSAVWLIDYANLGLTDMVDKVGHEDLTLLSDYSAWAACPFFSYDGQYVYYCQDMLDAFSSGTDGWDRYNAGTVMMGATNFDMIRATTDGLTVERINDDIYSQGIMSASPDGTLLAYCDIDPTDGDGVDDLDIYIQQMVVSEDMDAGGGNLSDGSGTTVTVPSGALSSTETITIETPLPGSEPPLDTLPASSSSTMTREFGPDSLTFLSQPTMDFHYTDEEVAGLNEATLEVHTYDNLESEWVYLPTVSRDPSTNVITAQTDHFSTFGVLGNASRTCQFLQWVPSFSGTSAPELVRGGINHGNNRVMAQVKDASTDAQLKQVFFTLNFEPISLVVLPDFSGTSTPELACLGRRASDGCNLAHVADASSGALLKRVYFHAEFLPYDMEWMPDFGLTSAPELVTLARRSSDTAIMGAKRDASSRFMVNPRTWFAATFLPVDIEIMGDINGNGVDELVSLQQRTSDNEATSEVRDASTNVLIQRVWFGTLHNPLDVEVVTDFGGGSSAPELAMLGQTLSGGAVEAVVRDSSADDLISTVAFSNSYSPLDIEMVSNFGGDSSAPELVVLSYDPATDAVAGEVRDASTGTLIGTVSFDSAYLPKGIEVLTSFDGTSAPELAVHGVNQLDGSVIGEVKDASSGAAVSTCTFSKYFVIP